MAEIEDLQVELESIICVQKLERLIDLAKYFKLEIDPEVKTKLTVIRLLRKHIDETIANEPGISPQEQFLKDAASFLTGEPPPLEHAEEIAKLQKQYDELKTKSEQELSDVKQKLDALQGPTALKAKCNESTHETDTTVKQADEGKVQLSSAALLSLKREFKISGQIGDPGQTEKLTFVSLTNQIDYGIKCGYPEDEIIAAVTRSIAPQNFLRSYIENERLKDLILAKLRKILRLHFREKSAPEVYKELSVICQSPKESPQKFLFRALDLRNKVLFVSQEDDSKFDYGFPLVQNTFLKSLETGLRDDILVTNLRPILRTPDISDEDLMKHVNELTSNQAERQSKLEQKSAKVNSTKVIEGQRASKTKENPKLNDELLTEIREIKSDLAMLKQQNNSNFVAPSSWPRDRNLNRGRGRGRGRVRGSAPRMYRGCPNCQSTGQSYSCEHCFKCGSPDHYKSDCPSFQQQGNGNRLCQGDRV